MSNVKAQLIWIDAGDDRDVASFKTRAQAARFAHRRRWNQSIQCRHQRSSDYSDDAKNCCKQSRHPGGLIKWKGNSDPFRCQIIDITPVVTGMWSFLLHGWIPALCLQSMDVANVHFKDGVHGALIQMYVDAMQHEWSASATLLPIAATLAALSPSVEIDKQRTQFKLATIVHLRTGLGGDERRREDSLMPLVHSLFGDAVTAQNFLEAKSHGAALQQLMRTKTDRDGFSSLDAKLFSTTLWYDVFRSNLTLTPSLFDVDAWAPALLQARSKQVLTIVEPMRDGFARELDKSVRGTPLESFCIGVRQQSWFCEQRKSSQDVQVVMDMMFWVANNYLILHLQCTNYYVQAYNLTQLCSRVKSAAARSESTYWHTQACVALGIMLCQVSHMTDPTFGGRLIWPRGKKLAGRLQYHLQHILSRESSTCSTSGAKSNALLFATWAGATWSYNASADVDSFASSYFCGTFTSLAPKLGLQTWDDVVAVIDRFMPAEPITKSQQQTAFHDALMPKSP